MLNCLNTKAKAFVVFVFSLSFMEIFVLSSLFATQVCQKWYGLAIGIVMTVIAIPFHCKGKKTLWGYLASFIINSLASGFVVSAYYLKAEIVLDVYSMIVGAIPAAAIVFVTFLILQSFSKTKKVTVTVAVILNIILTVTEMVLWIRHGDVVFSFGFFCSLISFFYLCVYAVTINHDERSVFRDVSFGGFGAFIIIAVVVLFILSEGEILEGMDVGGGDTAKKSKSKNK